MSLQPVVGRTSPSYLEPLRKGRSTVFRALWVQSGVRAPVRGLSCGDIADWKPIRVYAMCGGRAAALGATCCRPKVGRVG